MSVLPLGLGSPLLDPKKWVRRSIEQDPPLNKVLDDVSKTRPTTDPVGVSGTQRDAALYHLKKKKVFGYSYIYTLYNL